MPSVGLTLALLAAVAAAVGPLCRHRAARLARTGVLVLLAVFAARQFLERPFEQCVQRGRCTPYHYVLGSKYFDELGYFHLYRMTALAGRETGAFDPLRCERIRKLQDYSFESPKRALRQAVKLRPRLFTDARWAEFKADVVALRRLRSGESFCRSMLDHGFNPPPAWSLVPGTLIQHVPFGRGLRWKLVLGADALLIGTALVAVAVVAGLDGALLIFLFGTLAWWNEGHQLGTWWGFAWFAALLGSMAALRADRPKLAGALLGAAASFRAFPLLFILGPGVQLLEGLRHRRLHPRWTPYLAAFFATCLALGLLGLTQGGGPDATFAWLKNIALHTETIRYEANKLGLRNALADWPWSVGTSFAARRAFIEGHPLLFGGAVLLLLGVTVGAALRGRDREDWAVPLGATPIFAVLTLSRYYHLLWAAWLVAPRGQGRSVVPAVAGATLLAVDAAFWAFVGLGHDGRPVWSLGGKAFALAAFALPAVVWWLGARDRARGADAQSSS